MRRLHELGNRARGLAVDAGLLPYRPLVILPAGGWDRGYDEGEWDRMADLQESARYAVLLGYLDRVGGAPTMLDVGCGVGLLRERLRPESFSVFVGVDVSANAIAQAQHLADDRTTFVAGDITAVAGQRFDVVVCNEMLYYVEDVPAFLAAVTGVLHPGAHLLTSVWRHPGDGRLHGMLDRSFTLVDRVEVANRVSRRLRWRVSWHRAKDAG